MWDIVLGVVIGLVLHISFLRITTYATDKLYGGESKLVIVVYLIRFLLWFTWWSLALEVGGEDSVVYGSITITGLVTWCLWLFDSERMDTDRKIKASPLYSWLDSLKLVPWCHNRLRKQTW